MLCSCLISRNLLSGLKTCIELSSYMFDDEAGMPPGAIGMTSSFSEDKKKLDAYFIVCFILLPFFSSFLIVGLGNYLVHFCVSASSYFLKDLKLAPFSNYLYWCNWLVDFFTETNSYNNFKNSNLW